MNNPYPKTITFDDTSVTVKMMDDSWIINQCLGHSPSVPKSGVVWSHKERCSRLLIPGDKYEQAMRYFRNTYGNAAVIAWDNNIALGHIIFVPKSEARERKMLFYERMPFSPYDDETLVVQAVAFCSIGGQKYRGRGIGRAMTELMIEWAAINEWRKIQIYGVPSGLFPGDWRDSCMPPNLFWQKFGFEIFSKAKSEETWEQVKAGTLGMNPRNNPEEMTYKKDIIAKVEQGKISEEEWAFEFDMEKSLTNHCI